MSLWCSVRDVTHWGQMINEVLAKVWSMDLSSDHFPSPWVYNWSWYTWQLKSPPHWVLGLWDFPLSSLPPPLPAKKVNKTQYCILGERWRLVNPLKTWSAEMMVPIIAAFNLAVWFLQKLVAPWRLTRAYGRLYGAGALISTVGSHTILHQSNTG